MRYIPLTLMIPEELAEKIRKAGTWQEADEVAAECADIVAEALEAAEDE